MEEGGSFKRRGQTDKWLICIEWLIMQSSGLLPFSLSLSSLSLFISAFIEWLIMQLLNGVDIHTYIIHTEMIERKQTVEEEEWHVSFEFWDTNHSSTASELGMYICILYVVHMYIVSSLLCPWCMGHPHYSIFWSEALSVVRKETHVELVKCNKKDTLGTTRLV